MVSVPQNCCWSKLLLPETKCSQNLIFVYRNSFMIRKLQKVTKMQSFQNSFRQKNFLCSVPSVVRNSGLVNHKPNDPL